MVLWYDNCVLPVKSNKLNYILSFTILQAFLLFDIELIMNILLPSVLSMLFSLSKASFMILNALCYHFVCLISLFPNFFTLDLFLDNIKRHVHSFLELAVSSLGFRLVFPIQLPNTFYFACGNLRRYFLSQK